MSKEEKEILLNIMYNGDYLQSENQNIGHEIINLFQDDNGNNYIYVLPYGNMAEKHNDKIETILLVKRHNACLLEILAKAENLEQIIKLTGSRPECEKVIHKKQIEYIKQNKITYEGVLLYEIMGQNEGIENEFYVTFKAEKIIRPKKRIFISTEVNNENCFRLDISHFPKQSPKMYISNIENEKAYNELNEIIKDENLWNRNRNKKKVELPQTTQSPDKNFIDIIKKGYDELSYSNLFQYIFTANAELFHKFVKEVLKVEFSNNYIVERERNNIDLLVHDSNNVVVIENKIKSGINGICCNGRGEIIKTQLDKYVKYIEKEKEFKKKQKAYFVFVPDYNLIDLEEYDKYKKYKIVKYSEIYQFFESYRKSHRRAYQEIPYFDEFLYALKKHASDTDNNNDIEIEARFIKAILATKKRSRSKQY